MIRFRPEKFPEWQSTRLQFLASDWRSAAFNDGWGILLAPITNRLLWAANAARVTIYDFKHSDLGRWHTLTIIRDTTSLAFTLFREDIERTLSVAATWSTITWPGTLAFDVNWPETKLEKFYGETDYFRLVLDYTSFSTAPHSCAWCVVGKYKSNIGNETCDDCPFLSSSIARSTALSACVCNAGTTDPTERDENTPPNCINVLLQLIKARMARSRVRRARIIPIRLPATLWALNVCVMRDILGPLVAHVFPAQKVT